MKSEAEAAESAAERAAYAGVDVAYHYASPKTYPLDNEKAKADVPPEQYRNYPGYAYVTHSAFVEVDTETGKTKVLKVIAAHDCGRVINPHVCEGQIEGSCSMGISACRRHPKRPSMSCSCMKTRIRTGPTGRRGSRRSQWSRRPLP